MAKKDIGLNGKHILVTGAAGFIGSSLCKKLLLCTENTKILGIDNLNDYNPVVLKKWRLNTISLTAKKTKTKAIFDFKKLDIKDKNALDDIFASFHPTVVIHLAAQAGVRYSIENPYAYLNSNLIGFFNILEACRSEKTVEHLVYASSSSVYGENTKVPFCTTDITDTPISLYAATKKCNELLAYSYAKLYEIPCTGLRFFTVYGPAGRTDMAYFSFAKKLISGEKIKIFNYGKCRRDFTYIDDIVEGIFRIAQKAPFGSSNAEVPAAIYNIGGGNPVELLDFIQTLQDALVAEALLPPDFDFMKHADFLPMQPGDVLETFADTTALEADYSFTPKVSLKTGLKQFTHWYKEFYIDGGRNI